MDEVILSMLKPYKCKSQRDYENALKEIIQQVTLLGLWRSKFFEHALFYGGTALRILYGLNRFSEDMDFSLFKKKQEFNLDPYLKSISDELTSFGFEVSIEKKIKKQHSQIKSLFVKANTLSQLTKMRASEKILRSIQNNQLLKIKIELDTQPPDRFTTEVKNIFQPIPFQVRTMCMEDLFAGKLHAVLARKWKTRVKGRDFYDFLWYIGKQTHCHIEHLKERLVQSGDWNPSKPFGKRDFVSLMEDRIRETDFLSAKRDVAPFLNARDQNSLNLWNQNYFLDVISDIKIKSDKNHGL